MNYFKFLHTFTSFESLKLFLDENPGYTNVYKKPFIRKPSKKVKQAGKVVQMYHSSNHKRVQP